MRARVAGFILIVFLFQSCEKLNVENFNEPDYKTAYSGDENIESLASGLINNWFMTIHDYRGWALPLLAAADAGTSSWTYSRHFSSEPRTSYNNKPSFSLASMNENFYSSLYANLASANDVINLLDSLGTKMDPGEKAMMRAVAWFAHGISLGYLGLVYDKGFIATNETDVSEKIPMSAYRDIILASVTSLDSAIAICTTSSFVIPSEWLPGETWTNEDFGRLAKSFAARLLVYSARNKEDDNATDWAKVYDYAFNGIDKDFAPLADDIKWYSSYHSYANYSGFGLTDMYVVKMMDPAMPSRWVDENTREMLPTHATSHKDGVDDRIFTDFQYLTSCTFRIEYGYYHFSCYRYRRLDNYLDNRKEPMPEFRKEENDYLLAEAAVRTGRLQEAADLINASPRITRGNLPPVTADTESIIKAIHHERMVELMCSGFGIQFFQMRKENKLQPGSPLHYPIPGSQLEIMNIQYYTYGGNEGLPGIDYSNGGW